MYAVVARRSQVAFAPALSILATVVLLLLLAPAAPASGKLADPYPPPAGDGSPHLRPSTPAGREAASAQARDAVRLRAVAAADGRHACAVGNDGAIFSTLNGGKTWRKRVSPVSSDLVDVCYASPSRVWAVSTYAHVGGGMACAIIRSTDGGRTWKLFTRGHISLFGVDFVGRYYGFVAGDDIYRITGADNAWTHVAAAPTAFGSIDFVTRSRGWALAGIEGVFRTDDGGRTWHHQGDPAPESWDLSMLDGSYGWITGGPHQGDDPLRTVLLRTTDGGRTWVDTNKGFVKKGRLLYGIACANRSVTWAVGRGAGGRGYIYKTDDGGRSWKLQRTLPSGLDDVCCVSGKVAWAIGGKRIYKTANGVTWMQQK